MKCEICGVNTETLSSFSEECCVPCADLLQWFREYFRGDADLDKIQFATTFSDLGVESLDYIDWLHEAKINFDIEISDKGAERFKTVGQFLGYLRTQGAKPPSSPNLN
jgi:acyl carrier protein